MIKLNLPARKVVRKFSPTVWIERNSTITLAEFDGPGCIQRIWMVPNRGKSLNRNCILRIYFDGCPTPYVEAPLGDFFGVMHGELWYPINTEYISVTSQNSYCCYFPMPFASGARLEVETGPEDFVLIFQVDWNSYPEEELEEEFRFCCRWRREYPTERYGDDYLLLDADGPGRLLGFFYGVILSDDEDRWSHGGAENIYIDGQGKYPTYLRGIGGEDTFVTSFGGAMHTPETHLYAGMPYYVHEDTGEARPAQRLTGYRFFEHDIIEFEESMQFRFGCMRNDICSTAYWYQKQPVRPFFEMPEFPYIMQAPFNVFNQRQELSMPRGTHDLPIPGSGSWFLCGPFGNQDDCGMKQTLDAENDDDYGADYDGLHEEKSPWLTEGSRRLKRDRAQWIRREAQHGFIDFNHVFRPSARGAGIHHTGVAVARGFLELPEDMELTIHLGWDEKLQLQIDDGPVELLADHSYFQGECFKRMLPKGKRRIQLKQSNSSGTNNGGWAFSFHATMPDGKTILPSAD